MLLVSCVIHTRHPLVALTTLIPLMTRMSWRVAGLFWKRHGFVCVQYEYIHMLCTSVCGRVCEPPDVLALIGVCVCVQPRVGTVHLRNN